MKNLIAPCGINCGICLYYLRAENKCPGCNSGRKVNNKPIKCGRKLCKERKSNFCYECERFPCDSIKRLDKRYRERYGMSPINNLENIRDKGIDNFLLHQRKKYQSKKDTLCVHDKKYY
jgi:hypothetical protein